MLIHHVKEIFLNEFNVLRERKILFILRRSTIQVIHEQEHDKIVIMITISAA